ncbi:hypothetical protein HGRIS_000045 [Hohenbuehelia grisea]|uniref:Uncharacterized protein n=1 Tax=Hohenbuehelia grisea TaxID=104357 RepID=A0ABR3JQN7_9AGAR
MSSKESTKAFFASPAKASKAKISFASASDPPLKKYPDALKFDETVPIYDATGVKEKGLSFFRFKPEQLRRLHEYNLYGNGNRDLPDFQEFVPTIYGIKSHALVRTAVSGLVDDGPGKHTQSSHVFPLPFPFASASHRPRRFRSSSASSHTILPTMPSTCAAARASSPITPLIATFCLQKADTACLHCDISNKDPGNGYCFRLRLVSGPSTS